LRGGRSSGVSCGGRRISRRGGMPLQARPLIALRVRGSRSCVMTKTRSRSRRKGWCQVFCVNFVLWYSRLFRPAGWSPVSPAA
jgi:hypothetical protein